MYQMFVLAKPPLNECGDKKLAENAMKRLIRMARMAMSVSKASTLSAGVAQTQAAA